MKQTDFVNRLNPITFFEGLWPAALIQIACVQTSPISFVARGKGTLFSFPRATKEIGDVCTQAIIQMT